MVGGRQADALGSTITTGTPPARGSAAVEFAPTFAGGTIAPGVDGTLAAGSAPPNAASAVIVRAGRLDDYPALVEIERKHFVVGTEIARGGMGRIVSARDRRLGRDVAIKELLVTTPDLRARFEREARITANLQHPAIVNVLEAGRWPDGDTAGALAAYIAARAIEDEQARRDPTNIDPMWLLVINHAAVAELHEDKNELPAAIDDYTQARDLAANVAAAQPKNVDAQQLLSGCEEYLGNAFEKQGNHEAALAHYRSANGVVSRLAALEPTNFMLQLMLAADHGHIGEILLRAHDRSGAATELTAALTAADAAAKLQPDEPELKQLMPQLQKNLAKAGGGRCASTSIRSRRGGNDVTMDEFCVRPYTR